jgi:methylglutaconyl-CoA hydratase
VGIAAAADYALAVKTAVIKLSELDLGIGPFVVGPVIERKIGRGPFSALTMDTDWREALWAKQHGLYVEVFETVSELDAASSTLAHKLSKRNPEAMAKLKNGFYEGTDHWDMLLEQRAEMSGKMILSDFTANALAPFMRSGKPL